MYWLWGFIDVEDEPKSSQVCEVSGHRGGSHSNLRYILALHGACLTK